MHGRQRHAHRPALGVDPLGELRDLRERLALLGRRADDLLQQHRHADASPARGVEAVLHRDVVVRHDGRDLDALALREVGRHLEVEDVARVVLDDVQDAGTAVDRLRRLQHLVRRGGGEDLPRACGVEHALAHESAVHGLVPRASAGDDSDLALDRSVRTYDVGGVVGDLEPVSVSRLDPLEGLANDVVGRVDELLHAISLARRPRRAARLARRRPSGPRPGSRRIPSRSRPCRGPGGSRG